jgi:carboxyl-terminal processing protease
VNKIIKILYISTLLTVLSCCASNSQLEPTSKIAGLRLFTNAFAIIKLKHVTEVSDRKLIVAAINGIYISTGQNKILIEKDLPELPQSEYLKLLSNAISSTEKKFPDINRYELLVSATKSMIRSLGSNSELIKASSITNKPTKNYAAIGIQIKKNEMGLKIIRVYNSTPAQRAGLLSGDIILKINESDISNFSLSKTLTLLRGNPGSTMSLRVARAGKIIDLSIQREILNLPNSYVNHIDSNTLYIGIIRFGSNILEELTDKFKINNVNFDAIKNVVLDLRGNGGGDLQSSIDLANLFINEQLIFSSSQRDPGKTLFYHTDNNVLFSGKIIIVVDQDSSGGSLILTRALHKYRDAIVAGSQMKGIDYIYTFHDLNHDLNTEYLLKLSTGTMIDSDGNSFSQGDNPDICLTKIHNGECLKQSLLDVPVTELLRQINYKLQNSPAKRIGSYH